MSEIASTETRDVKVTSAPPPDLQGQITVLLRMLYTAALAAALSIWLLAIRAPFWLDETLSYWQIDGGFARIWSRSALMPSSIGYLYMLWLVKMVFGSTEIALKIPSTLALLATVYFLFRLTREYFDRETAFLTCVFFALEGNVVFAATDARPYAFALLTLMIAVCAFVRWLHRHQIRYAVGFGIASAAIVYFHYLFTFILPAFAIYYLIVRWRWIKEDARQLAAVSLSFLLCALPLMCRIASLYDTRQTHVVQEMPHPGLVTLNTLVPQQTLIGFGIIVFLAAFMRKVTLPARDEFPMVLLGPVLALVPAAILIVLSTAGSAHLLIPRYLTVATPGAALTWGLLTKRVESRWLRVSFCVGLVAVTLFEFYNSPLTRLHEVTFKQAHEFVNANIKDRVPVLVCSGFIESNYMSMPIDLHGENALLSQFDYYPIHAPVVLLPLNLNDETKRVASKAILDAAQRRQRFLVVAGLTSRDVLQWLADQSRGSFRPRVIARYGEIVVAEFQPAPGSN